MHSEILLKLKAFKNKVKKSPWNGWFFYDRITKENMQKVYKISELEEAVKFFLQNLGDSRVLGFSGNLGAGKTTFTKELLKQLGFSGSVISPTFVLRRDYEIDNKKIIHIDAYRLEKLEHIYQVISKEELQNKNNLVIVEWPELSENIFDAIYLFQHVDENTRKISKK